MILYWDEMEKIWEDLIFTKLKFDKDEMALFFTESVLNTKRKREKMCEIMFEKFESKKNSIFK